MSAVNNGTARLLSSVGEDGGIEMTDCTVEARNSLVVTTGRRH